MFKNDKDYMNIDQQRTSVKIKREPDYPDYMDIDETEDQQRTSKIQGTDTLRTLLIQSYQKLIYNDKKALKRFDSAKQTFDDVLYYNDADDVIASIEGNGNTISKLQNYDLPAILKHIFGDLNCVEEHTIDENEDKFRKILNIFIEHFDKICHTDKKAYLEGAINICGDRENFNNLKIKLAINLEELQSSKQQQPKFHM